MGWMTDEELEEAHATPEYKRIFYDNCIEAGCKWDTQEEFDEYFNDIFKITPKKKEEHK